MCVHSVLTKGFLPAACGGFIELNDNDPPGYITSPNYPQNYPQNIDCVWVISVPNGEAVQIEFEDDFYIEPTSRYRCYSKLLFGHFNIYLLWLLLFLSFMFGFIKWWIENHPYPCKERYHNLQMCCTCWRIPTLKIC